MADGGTIFLDEVDSMPASIQAKLLRFLESGEIQPVGARSPRNLDVRVIAACGQNLEGKVREGQFRRDLYYRLHVIPLHIPPLRERRSDVELLVWHFIDEYAKAHGGEGVRISKEGMTHMESYVWPGNVRQLRNMCHRLCVLYPGRVIQSGDLPRELIEFNIREKALKLNVGDLGTGGDSLETMEIEMIKQVLQRAGNNRTHAAKMLEISRDKLLYRMRKHGLR